MTRRFFRIAVFILVPVLSAPPGVVRAAEEQSPREKILTIRARALRDRSAAEALRRDAQTQISNARSILERAKANPGDPAIKGREEVLQRAPEALSYGERVLAKAEKGIQEAELRVRWADRALANLKEGPDAPKQFYAGGAFPLSLRWRGQVKVTAGDREGKVFQLDQRGILPDDLIETGGDARVEIMSYYNPDNVLTLGPDTEFSLAKDSQTGTRWNLLKGKIHSAPVSLDSKLPPRITTPRGDVEASPGSEFDIVVDEEGQTTVTPYRGEVKVVPFKGDSVWPDLVTYEDRKPVKTPWWEEK
ncbi:MAG TPA: FecR domain-containing protein [Candidatus Eisenbacteria bacterium]|nr:FecR domain-containing protein [Candidatus Eisenbacteria bacterium]